jgi:hypothetical protein
VNEKRTCDLTELWKATDCRRRELCIMFPKKLFFWIIMLARIHRQMEILQLCKSFRTNGDAYNQKNQHNIIIECVRRRSEFWGKFFLDFSRRLSSIGNRRIFFLAAINSLHTRVWNSHRTYATRLMVFVCMCLSLYLENYNNTAYIEKRQLWIFSSLCVFNVLRKKLFFHTKPSV